MYLHVDWEKVDRESLRSSRKLGLLIKWSLIYKVEKNQNSSKKDWNLAHFHILPIRSRIVSTSLREMLIGRKIRRHLLLE